MNFVGHMDGSPSNVLGPHSCKVAQGMFLELMVGILTAELLPTGLVGSQGGS